MEELKSLYHSIRDDHFIMGLIFIGAGLLGVARTNETWFSRGRKKLGIQFWHQRLVSFFLIIVGLFLVLSNLSEWLGNEV